MKRTALYPEHLRLGAKMTDFHGWEMPLYYTSILEEHNSVRTAAGIFDISHMGQLCVSGPDALATLDELFVSDLTQVDEGRACYTLMLEEGGGILDDVIVYHLGSQMYLVVVNCATHSQDYEWLASHRRGKTEISDISAGRSILAIQGPGASQLLEEALGGLVRRMGRFDVMAARTLDRDAWIARTGYTGSDGFEVFLSDSACVRLWQRLLKQGRSPGIEPVGLGARDTLRLEAGLRLYGTDMDKTTSPYEADLGWTVAIHKNSFIGKEALVRQKAAGLTRRLIGFSMEQGPVPRKGLPLIASGRRVGTVSSGTFSWCLNKPIGLGYVEISFAVPGTELSVLIRNQQHSARVVKLPFWRAEAKMAQWPSGPVAQSSFGTQSPNRPITQSLYDARPG